MALSYPNTFTYKLNGTGGVAPIQLPSKVRSLRLKIDDSAAAGECWVRVPLSPASAPADSTDPAPSANALSAAGWVHLKGPGSEYELKTLEFGFYEYIEPYDVAAGGLQIVAEEA